MTVPLRRLLSGMLLPIAAVLPLAAQQPAAINIPMNPLQQALAAERRGDHEAAIPLFVAVLNEHPDEVAAVLGLARILPPLGRGEELIGHLRKAIEIDPRNTGFHSLAVRQMSLLKWADSAERIVGLWVAEAGDSEEPYREWALAALEARDRETARRALSLGQQRIPEPARLSPERAQLYQMDGDYAGAAAEWLRAIGLVPAFRQSAVQLLSAAPAEMRDTVGRVLAADGSVEAERVLGYLMMKWGDLREGSALLTKQAPAMTEEARMLFRPALDELRSRRDPAALLARGTLLEAQAARETGADRVRVRVDAARAYADAGDEVKARALLAMIAEDPDASPQVASSASTTLLGVLLAEGKAHEADSLLRRVGHSLTLDELDHERRRVAMAYARTGDLRRADSMLAVDTSIAGFDARGRVRAFMGDLKGASELLRLAGPFDDDRAFVVRRVAIGALIQMADADSSAEMGNALLALERGDTAAAVAALERAAADLGPAGAAAVLVTAGDLAVAVGDAASAARQYLAAEERDLPASSARARHGRATLMLAAGDTDGALKLVESILLDFPDSAVVPAARRLRDQMIGAVPGRDR